VIPVFHQVGNAAVWVAFAAAVLFCVGYAVLAPWRSSAEGWHLMTMTAVIGLAFGWIAYRLVAGAHMPPLLLEVLRALILGGLAATLVWRLALLIRNQVQRRR
jgi:hypothetical protein